MFNIKTYENLLKSTTFHQFLDILLLQIEKDLQNYGISDGFIAFLDAKKINERFNIITSFGEFSKNDNLNVITTKEIDMLSIAYILKESFVKNNIYIDIIEHDNKDIFIYLLFNDIIKDEIKEELKILFKDIKEIIKEGIELMNNIVKNIESLPPLPRTIIDVINFSKADIRTPEKLISIIQNDSLLISSLLKISNSALFGFRNKVDSIDNMVNLLGVDFTISLILANSLENSFAIDFSPYGIDTDTFRELTLLSINFLNIWISKVDIELKNRLLLPVILMNLGKHMISNEVIKQDKKDEFLGLIKKNILKIPLVEKKYCNLSSIDVTVLLLEHWNININIIEDIKYIEHLNSVPLALIKSAKILSIVNIICNVSLPFDEITINEARIKAKNYNFDMDIFDTAVQKMQDRLLDLD